MAQKHLVKLKSTSSNHVIRTRRNKKSTMDKLNLKKFDPTIRKRVDFKEMKK
ncbi:MAG: 50S ribosomal protein L33 [Candidatus Pacebacteria bacterium]|nr:50S ribosomal protein L33 [Candidatus Paceibacterota bacterium]